MEWISSIAAPKASPKAFLSVRYCAIRTSGSIPIPKRGGSSHTVALVIYHPSSIIHHPSSMIYHPSSHRLSSIVYHPPSIIHHPSFYWSSSYTGLPTSSCRGSCQGGSGQWALGRSRKTGTSVYFIVVSTCDESTSARSRPRIRGKTCTKNKADTKGVPHQNEPRTRHTVQGMFPAGWLTF